MRFLGIAESFSPVGSFLLANPDQGAAFRSGPVQAIGMRRKERIRWFYPSVPMSSGRPIPHGLVATRARCASTGMPRLNCWRFRPPAIIIEWQPVS
jgi:hypothetical protein